MRHWFLLWLVILLALLYFWLSLAWVQEASFRDVSQNTYENYREEQMAPDILNYEAWRERILKH